MNKKIRWMTETAVLLALLVSLQAITKPLGQLVTGSAVNSVLALSVLLCGLGSGIAIALISPVLAFLLGIAPQILTVPAIALGNGIYVALLWLLIGKTGGGVLSRISGWILAAFAKFVTLYLVVAKLICGIWSESLLSAGVLKQPMLQALPATFSWPQLFTALIGGGIALAIVLVLRKALHKL